MRRSARIALTTVSSAAVLVLLALREDEPRPAMQAYGSVGECEQDYPGTGCEEVKVLVEGDAHLVFMPDDFFSRGGCFYYPWGGRGYVFASVPPRSAYGAAPPAARGTLSGAVISPAASPGGATTSLPAPAASAPGVAAPVQAGAVQSGTGPAAYGFTRNSAAVVREGFASGHMASSGNSHSCSASRGSGGSGYGSGFSGSGYGHAGSSFASHGGFGHSAGGHSSGG